MKTKRDVRSGSVRFALALVDSSAAARFVSFESHNSQLAICCCSSSRSSTSAVRASGALLQASKQAQLKRADQALRAERRTHKARIRRLYTDKLLARRRTRPRRPKRRQKASGGGGSSAQGAGSGQPADRPSPADSAGRRRPPNAGPAATTPLWPLRRRQLQLQSHWLALGRPAGRPTTVRRPKQRSDRDHRCYRRASLRPCVCPSVTRARTLRLPVRLCVRLRNRPTNHSAGHGFKIQPLPLPLPMLASGHWPAVLLLHIRCSQRLHVRGGCTLERRPKAIRGQRKPS